MPTPEQTAAMSEIRRLAANAGLAVSVVTVEDVLTLKGVDTAPTPEQRDAVRSSWEWKHYGDSWSDWFEGFALDLN